MKSLAICRFFQPWWVFHFPSYNRYNRSVQGRDNLGTDLDAEHEKEINSVVERIALFPPLKRSPLLIAFLRYSVKESLSGDGDKLTAYPIALDVFDRPPSVDPNTDPIVRVQAGRLRNLLEEYYETPQGRQEKFRVKIPKGTYGAVFLNSADEDAEGVETTMSDPAQDTSTDAKRRAFPLLQVTVGVLVLSAMAIWLLN